MFLCLSVCRCTCLSICLSVCLYVFLYVCLSVCLSLCQISAWKIEPISPGVSVDEADTVTVSHPDTVEPQVSDSVTIISLIQLAARLRQVYCNNSSSVNMNKSCRGSVLSEKSRRHIMSIITVCYCLTVRLLALLEAYLRGVSIQTHMCTHGRTHISAYKHRHMHACINIGVYGM